MIPTILAFRNQVVGAASAAQTVCLVNKQGVALNITGISATGDFAEIDNCGTSLGANSSCKISVTSTPSATGNRAGALTISAGAPTAPPHAPGATAPTPDKINSEVGAVATGACAKTAR